MPPQPRHAERAAVRATAIAAGSAAAVYAERGTIANGLAAWHPSRAHNKVIGAPSATCLARTPRRIESAIRVLYVACAA
jgi:hypothetical protein